MRGGRRQSLKRRRSLTSINLFHTIQPQAVPVRSILPMLGSVARERGEECPPY